MEAAGREKVSRISVNLEESAEQVLAVLERLEIRAPVALDLEGAVAQEYQVSLLPQVVLIDADGTVAGLYVGGGPEMLEPMTAALKQLVAPSDEVRP
jgi:hypothetical protein